MTLEEIRRSNNSEDESNNDQFPVGMRVLAVDDDKTCLMVLESLLRRCKYHVTTATHAVTALKMLRENKNKFDLVISDVQMPDMDGFKLLELVGLEMDLPVIMLSGNGDPRLVMKGVTHGACDYLLKPVRFEELKNIWQHVIRRKKSDRKDRNNLDNQEKSYDGGPDDGQNPAVSSPERNTKQVRKRKEQDEEEEGSGDEDGNENEDSTSQKKPRVVWSVELHRKFVAAVNQLGIDKAVPKKILDLMNVERLTRENVASHLQKYRLYLKRLSCVASQQANIVAAFGGKDPSSYMRLGSMDGLGDFQGFHGSGQLPNSIPQGGMLGRLNTATSLGMRSLNSAGMIHMGHSQSSSSSVNDYGKLQQVVHPGNQRGNLVQGMPNTLELDQLQHNQNISHIGEFSPGDSTVFPVSSGFTNNGMAIGNLNNSYLNGPNNSLMLQGPQQQRQNRGTFVNQPPARMPSLNSEPFEIGGGASSQLPDLGRCNDNWQSGVPLNGFASTPMTSADPFNHSGLSSRDNMTMVSPHAGNNLINVPAQNMASANMLDSRNITGQPGPANLQHSNPNMLNSRNVTSQPGPVNLQQGNPNFSTFGSMSNGVQQNMNFAPKQEWVGQNQDGFGSLNPVIPIQGVVTPLGQTMSRTTSLGNGKFDRTLGQNMGQSTGGNGKFDMTLNTQPNGAAPYLGQQNGGDKGTMPSTMKLNVEHFFDVTKSQDGTNSSCGSLEDLMSAMYRRERDDLGGIMDGDLNLDVFPVGTCM